MDELVALVWFELAQRPSGEVHVSASDGADGECFAERGQRLDRVRPAHRALPASRSDVRDTSASAFSG